MHGESLEILESATLIMCKDFAHDINTFHHRKVSTTEPNKSMKPYATMHNAIL